MQPGSLSRDAQRELIKAKISAGCILYLHCDFITNPAYKFLVVVAIDYDYEILLAFLINSRIHPFIMGKPDLLPPTRSEITLRTTLLQRAIGTKELVQVDNVIKGERLLLDVGTTITVGTVLTSKKDEATLKLSRPICAENGARAAISRKIAGRWRLIGYGIIKH